MPFLRSWEALGVVASLTQPPVTGMRTDRVANAKNKCDERFIIQGGYI